ncbi:MAG: hypothetical protein P3W94_000255 [Paracoccus sp. (in: a-proteobacteria)]|nr:hypothetical protein [Paracoccus sp. (in: a-proteobacteria)]
MPYLMADDLPRNPARHCLRTALLRPGTPRLPGKQNGHAAGFEAFYLSGAAMAAAMGLPDLGIITVDEVTFFVRPISWSWGLSLLVGGDTDYGATLSVVLMFRSFKRACILETSCYPRNAAI